MEFDLSNWAPIISLVIGMFVAAFTINKYGFDISIGKQSQRREEYKFAKEFLEEIESNPRMHLFAKEKGYKALVPDRQPGVGLRDKLGSQEIEYLLSLKNPELALKNYILGRPYLENIFDNEVFHNGTPKIAFKKKYKVYWSRGLRKNIHFALYLFFAFLAFAPGVLYFLIPIWSELNSELLFKKWNWVTWVLMQLIFLVGFSWFAWLSLGVVIGIERAEELVNGAVTPGLFQELWERLLGLKKARLSFSNRGQMRETGKNLRQ
jgi:hypothetical protein